jgi:hypothetical protein
MMCLSDDGQPVGGDNSRLRSELVFGEHPKHLWVSWPSGSLSWATRPTSAFVYMLAMASGSTHTNSPPLQRWRLRDARNIGDDGRPCAAP